MISQEDLNLIGLKGYYNIGPGAAALIEIKEIRERYGHLDVKIAPVGGMGAMWVQRTSIEVRHD